MKPQVLIDQAITPDGKELVLYERDGAFTIRVDGYELMSSRAHGSEEDMASLALTRVKGGAPHLLVGGLGMGFTLRAVLNGLPSNGRVTVAELLADVVRWNRDHLGHLTGEPLEDPRVSLAVDDVARVMASNPSAFDAVLLDVDNGPAALTDQRNEKLYRVRGLEATRRSLRPGGTLIVWSASPDKAFEKAMKKAGYSVRVETVRARRSAKGPKHTIFLGTI